ncbi:MAG: hypothetical protein ACYCO0_05065 [Candidatus Micrarchaeaceae archaeon]
MSLNFLFNKKIWLLVNILTVIISALLYWYLSQQIIGAILFILAILSIIWQFKDNNKKDSDNVLELARLYEQDKTKMREEYSAKEKQILSEKSETEAELDKARMQTTGLEKIVSKINETLKKEHISKEELINKIDSPQYMLMIQKYNEPPKEIQNRLLEYGFKTFGYGIYLLPPVKSRDLGVKADFDIKKWMEQTILKGLPKNYKYIINFAAIVDIRHMTSKRNIVEKARTYLDILEPEDLVRPEEIALYLKNKKNISIKDVIQIPNLIFLVDNFGIDMEDYNALNEHNDEILIAIKKKIKAKDIKTTDLATINEDTIESVLSKYTKKPKEITKMIIRNAKFWNRNLNGT